ncbi:MAG: leucine-rich repeat domain-containing protein [Chloroflexota bacterium]
MFARCNCWKQYGKQEWKEITFHNETQDTRYDAWNKLLASIEEAIADKRQKFAPLDVMTLEERSQILTLPSTISQLKHVTLLSLVGSFLVRIPPEIGEMTNLAKLDIYKSYALHWYPYEIIRCTNLKNSRVSTRSLYGNFKHRPPFPKLAPDSSSTAHLDLQNLPAEIYGTSTITHCSVCNQSLEQARLYQRWISLRVATDVLPLLVNACSEACLQKLPTPHENYVQEAHTGGLEIKQPPRHWSGGG